MYIYIFFILTGSIVLISTLVMTAWFKTNKILNFYIIFTSITLCFYLILHGIKKIGVYTNSYSSWSLNYSEIVLFLTPSIYLFFEKIIFDIKYPEKKDFYHFILPIISFNYFIKDFFLNNSIIKTIIFIYLIFFTFYYIKKSHSLLKKHVWDINYIEARIGNQLMRNWITFIFRMLIVVIIHFYVSEIVFLYFRVNETINLVLEGGFLTVFLVGYFKVITDPELLYGSSHLKKVSIAEEVSKLCINKVWILDSEKKISNDKDKLISIKIQEKIIDCIKKIEQIAIVNNSFRNPGYSIHDLAKEVGLPKYYIEFIFKYYCELSFNEYKKLVRIYVAVNLINNGFLNSNKLDSLARIVGFSSYNPFLINFKEITGVSPFEFNKKRKIYNSNYLLNN